MSGTRQSGERVPGERVAQAFARMLAAGHLRLGGDPAAAALLAAWAARAWSAADAGDACVAVDDAAARAALADSPMVAAGAAARPLVLDRGALYLYRLWQAECAIARAVRELDTAAPLAAAPARERALAHVFGRLDANDAQQRAVACALARRLTVLSGGPGTGKTTTLARLLVAHAGLAPQARVAFAAPTGKAAARLAQSVAQQLSDLDPTGEIGARLPALGLTVHRLLGTRAAGVAVLDFDLVIVDEASMLDIELAARLLEAIGPGTRLVLAGDRDQLASVEAGAVFADLCASAGDAVVVLGRNYRQQDAPDIAALAAQVRDAALAGSEWPASIALSPALPAAIVREAIAAWRDAFAAVAEAAPPSRVLAAWERHRVLAALRDGPLGVEALNRAIAPHVRRLSGAAPRESWYAGRLVMVTRNEPGLGLFNGDVGVCVAHAGPAGEPRPSTAAAASRLVVAFPGFGGEPRLFPVLQMPACEDAWAMTVHKAQGSEFESVALVPAAPGHPLNTREMVYTGVTRARSRLAIWGARATLEEASRRPVQRHGRLAARLTESAPPGDRTP
ncbi:MAG: exodeoxyribonuclease V subunit alpha [Burkholderiales bacterium]|nr:exodeoxyribonuclease V subunit alpha [Burkholderiales bacterium]OJX08326.1 MAG: exodeoxyribonuclease V subunit alpha [Burkholderiales bacterium 70-64]